MVCMERHRLPRDSGPKRPGSLWDQPCLNTKVARQSTPTGKTGAEICTSVVWIVNLKRQKVSPKITESPFLSGFGELERAKGIEPSYAAWEAAVLPLNYARSLIQQNQALLALSDLILVSHHCVIVMSADDPPHHSE
jgi:hypothetical protein